MSAEVAVFFVPGVPVPKGSGEGTAKQRGNRKRAAWRENIGLALPRVGPREPWCGPVGVSAVFYLEGIAGREPWEDPPDTDKLLRFVLDEFAGVFYEDDQQAISTPACEAAVRWSPFGPGAAFRVRQLRPDGRPVGDEFRWLDEVTNAVPELIEG